MSILEKHYTIMNRDENMSKKKYKVRRYDIAWMGKVQIAFNFRERMYSMQVITSDDPENCKICKIQKKTYKKFLENRKEIEIKVQQAVANYFSTTDEENIPQIIPYQLQFNTTGECALIAKIIEDESIQDGVPELAVVIYPKIAIFTKESYVEYSLIRKELYDEE